jgi:cell division control protein 7
MAPAAAAAAAADLLEMERAWYLLTVVVRLGRPAAVSDLAAFAAISPCTVERMCRIPESPLCLSDGGAVTASQTAFLTILRFVGSDVPAPRVSMRPSDVRRWCGEMPITYVLKRKASDAGRSGGKRHCLLAPDTGCFVFQRRQIVPFVFLYCIYAGFGENPAELNLGEFCADLVEHKQPKSLQLATRICAPVANGEV